MKMAQYTDFSRSVKHAMIDRDMRMRDLAAQVEERTGLFCDAAYLYHILRGDRNPAKIVSAIREILELGGEENAKAEA